MDKITESVTCPVTGTVRHFTNSFSEHDTLAEPKLTRQTCNGYMSPQENPLEETYVDNYLHSIADQPARRYPSRNEWYEHGKLHRTGGPAVENTELDEQEWWENGERHREGGPAIATKHYLEWWTRGTLVRVCMLPES
jgi:hypothetical protein